MEAPRDTRPKGKFSCCFWRLLGRKEISPDQDSAPRQKALIKSNEEGEKSKTVEYREAPQAPKDTEGVEKPQPPALKQSDLEAVGEEPPVRPEDLRMQLQEPSESEGIRASPGPANPLEAAEESSEGMSQLSMVPRLSVRSRSGSLPEPADERSVPRVNREANPLEITDQELFMQHLMLDRLARHKRDGKIDVYNPESQVKRAVSEAGLSRNQINSIMVNKYQGRKKDSEAQAECNICAVEFALNDNVKILQCLHTYHASCLDSWLAKKSVCPDCKFNLRTLDFQQLY